MWQFPANFPPRGRQGRARKARDRGSSCDIYCDIFPSDVTRPWRGRQAQASDKHQQRQAMSRPKTRGLSQSKSTSTRLRKATCLNPTHQYTSNIDIYIHTRNRYIYPRSGRARRAAGCRTPSRPPAAGSARGPCAGAGSARGGCGPPCPARLRRWRDAVAVALRHECAKPSMSPAHRAGFG